MTDKSKIKIITGYKGEGKSTLISHLIEETKKSNLNLQGLSSPALIKSGQKTGILVVDISTGKKKQLAFYKPGWDPLKPDREWEFNNEAIKWGNKVLKNIPRACDVLIIDEIGYLELEKKQGWRAVFSILEQTIYLRAYIVIRESLIEVAKEIWKDASVIQLLSVRDDQKWVSKEVEEIMLLKELHKDQYQRRP